MFDNGAGTWDNNNGNNYKVYYPGMYGPVTFWFWNLICCSYQVSSGVLTTIAVYDFGCASNCSGHGTCDDGVCECWDNYIGTYCSCGGDAPCNGQGSCLEGLNLPFPGCNSNKMVLVNALTPMALATTAKIV